MPSAHRVRRDACGAGSDGLNLQADECPRGIEAPPHLFDDLIEEGHLQALGQEAEDRVGDAHAVILSTGVNDTQVENGAVRLSPNKSATALDQLLQVTRDYGETLVVGPSPVSDDAHNQRIRRLSHRMQEQCQDQGVLFVPVVDALLNNADWMQEVAAGDGSHPGPRGYEILTRVVESSNSWANFCSGLRLQRHQRAVDA